MDGFSFLETLASVVDRDRAGNLVIRVFHVAVSGEEELWRVGSRGLGLIGND